MASAVKKYQVDIASNTSAIRVTAEPIASNTPEIFPVAHIIQVTPIFFDFSVVENNNSGTEFKATYPYAVMTRVILESHDGHKLDLELQSITNQPSWSTGTRAGLNAAVAAFNALL